MELIFKSDTSLRKQFFTPESFAHPAKMNFGLLLWIVEKYSQPGETILDPMAGMGTTMLACTLGRNVVLVELEEKFCKMCQDNWEIVRTKPQLGYQLGNCQIIQGDARQLEGLLGQWNQTKPINEVRPVPEPQQVDKIVTSNKGQSEGDMSIVYIAFFEVNNPIALLVKTLIPSSVFGSLSGRAMPEIAVSFNDSGIRGQEEVNEISTNPELTNKLNSLLSKVFGNRAFKTREPSFSVTFKGAEDTPITLDLIGIDIEGISAESTVAFYINSASNIKTFGRAKLSDASFNLANPYPELLLTSRASSPYSSPHTSDPTSTGAVFASIIGKLARSPSKELPAYLAGFLNTNSLSQDIIPLSILPQPIPQVNSVIFSPPYAESKEVHDIGFLKNTAGDASERVKSGKAKGHYFTKEARERALAKKEQGLIDNPDNVGNLPYGQIDKIVTSPPYEEAMGKKHHSPRADKLAKEKSNPVTYTDRVDSIITSPPYEGGVSGGGDPERRAERMKEAGLDPKTIVGGTARCGELDWQYGESLGNIGNLKSQSYLEAMLQVYQQCYKVLKPQGLMILVTKNFIRNKQIIRLDEDTIKLCEQAGFTFVERHYRKLTSQSFWRVIYHKKFPEVEQIKHEDILVFR